MDQLVFASALFEDMEKEEDMKRKRLRRRKRCEEGSFEDEDCSCEYHSRPPTGNIGTPVIRVVIPIVVTLCVVIVLVSTACKR